MPPPVSDSLRVGPLSRVLKRCDSTASQSISKESAIPEKQETSDVYFLQRTAKVWLVLAVISNVIGAVLTFSRIFNFRWSWIVTVLYMKLSWLFLINDPMPIIIDLCYSSLLQFISSFGDNGWKLVFDIAFLSPLSVMLVIGYKHLKSGVLLQLSPKIVKLAYYQICFLNVFLVIVALCFSPSNNWFYSNFQDYVGILLIMESFVYLSCYKQLKARTQGSSGTLPVEMEDKQASEWKKNK